MDAVIYLLIDHFRDAIANSSWLGPLGVFRWVEFRSVLAMVLSFLFVVTLGRRTIRWLVIQKIGDQPEFYNKDLNQLMKQKANTPTMGGVLIAGAIFIVTILLADLSSFYVPMALIVLVWLHATGLADDWLKLTTSRRKPGTREGLYTWEKLLLMIGLSVLIGIFVYYHGQTKYDPPDLTLINVSRSLTLPFFKTWVFEAGSYQLHPNLIVLSLGAFVVLTVLVMVGSANAVNLTDGMDGLACGVTAIVAFAFLVLCIIAGYRNEEFILAKYLLVPYVPKSDELAIVAGAMCGACIGFLWFNCHPASVFMGDSGSLPLGGLLGYIAIVIRQEFLLFIIGGIFVIEAISVMLQVGYFKATKRSATGGKRLFRMAPIHHHFHLAGWTEQQVVVRAWLITALLVAIALATIKVR